METNIEQRYAIKFCVRLNKTATDTLTMIQEAFKEDAMSRAMVFVWHKRFKDGRQHVEDDDRSGRPSTSRTDDNVTRVRDLLNTDRRLSTRLVADELGLSQSTVWRIVTDDLQMRKVCAKLVPKILSPEQKERRLTDCQDMLDRLVADPNFLDKTVTGDESWVYEYDPETKRQSEEWHTAASPKPKKARMSRSRVKSMLIVFFDGKGLIHKEFVPSGQTVTGVFYAGVLRRLRDRINRVRPEIKQDWILHHDNAPPHTARVTTETLEKMPVTLLPQPPYSPDLAPSDFFLFPLIKRDLKGKRFDTIDDVQEATTTALNRLSAEDFQSGYEQWKKRWQRCVDAQGAYFEEF